MVTIVPLQLIFLQHIHVCRIGSGESYSSEEDEDALFKMLMMTEEEFYKAS